MIIDKITNLHNYSALIPSLTVVSSYIKDEGWWELKNAGTLYLDDNIRFETSLHRLRRVSGAYPELHRSFIDLHLLHEGEETFGWTPAQLCESPLEPFDDVRDIGFYNVPNTLTFTLKPGYFVLFTPQDGHTPLLGDGEVLKTVFKIPVTE